MYNIILVIIERLIKYLIYILYKKSSTIKRLAFAFLLKVVTNYKVPKKIIFNRNKLFIS